MAQVDFADLKSKVRIEQVIEMLGIKLKPSGHQLRGPCPICADGGDRAFVVTPSKGLFYCFGKCRAGGDQIALASKVKGCSIKEAAEYLSDHFTDAGKKVPDQPSKPKVAFDVDKYAAGLDPNHPSLEPLGIAPETLKEWRAGFASTGVLRGRLGFPVTRDGEIVGYIGRTVKDDTPLLIFPNGVNPQEYIFGEDRLEEGPIMLVRDVLDVIRAYEAGMTNVIAFLTEAITPLQLETLSSLMDKKRCEALEF